MVLPYHTFQMVELQMCIDLRRGDVRMAKKRLDRAQIRAIFHHVRCRAMP